MEIVCLVFLRVPAMGWRHVQGVEPASAQRQLGETPAAATSPSAGVAASRIKADYD